MGFDDLRVAWDGDESFVEAKDRNGQVWRLDGVQVHSISVGFRIEPAEAVPIPVAWTLDIYDDGGTSFERWYLRIEAEIAMREAWERPSLRTWWAAVRAEWRSAWADAR